MFHCRVSSSVSRVANVNVCVLLLSRGTAGHIHYAHGLEVAGSTTYVNAAMCGSGKKERVLDHAHIALSL